PGSCRGAPPRPRRRVGRGSRRTASPPRGSSSWLLLAHPFRYLAVTPATSTSNQTRSPGVASGVRQVVGDCAAVPPPRPSTPHRKVTGRPELSGVAAQDH